MLFSDIPGLTETKKHLIATVNENRVAHAQLFAGLEGAPSLALALAYTSYLLCENKQDGDACNRCATCNKTQKYIHPDIQFIFPTAATSSIPRKDAQSSKFLKEWRNFLSENVYGTLDEWTTAFGAEDKVALIPVEESREVIKNLAYKAFEGSHKIVIIWLPEKMMAGGANALLKVLEEPPGNSLIILASNEPDNLLTTIQSRAQRLVIRKFNDEEITSYLSEKYGMDAVKAGRLSHLSDGDIHEAIELLSDAGHETHDWFYDWMRTCFIGNLTGLVERAEEFGKLSKRLRRNVLLYGLNMMRETAIMQTNPELGRVQGDDQKFVTNFSKVMDFKKVDVIVSGINDSLYHLDRNSNAKIEFLNLSLTISETFKK